MIIKMGGNDGAVDIIGRVLDGAKLANVVVARHHHQPAGMLACGPFDAGAAIGQTAHFGVMGHPALFFHIFQHKAIGRFIGQCADGAGFKDLALAEKLFCIGMGLLLIFAGKVQVDIRLLVPFKAQEGFKGNVMAFFV